MRFHSGDEGAFLRSGEQSDGSNAALPVQLRDIGYYRECMKEG